jgi:hypothetical protein
MIGLLLALYPAPWRRRYGEEFRAVLESRPLGPFDVTDVVLGALDARFALRHAETSSATGGLFNMLRIGGFSAVFGAAAWFIGIAAASGLGEGGRAWMALALAGNIGLVVALAGLSAFQGHRDPALAWIAFAIPAIGAVIAAIGIAGMLVLPEDGTVVADMSAWDVWIFGMFLNLVGSTFFAFATYQAQVLSARAAQALGISSGFALAVAIGSIGVLPAGLAFLVPVAILAFALSWMWLGISALRGGPIRAVAPA